MPKAAATNALIVTSSIPDFQCISEQSSISNTSADSYKSTLRIIICFRLDTKTTQLNQMQISILHLVFHRLTVVKVLFCSLKKGITRKIRMLCFVLINNVLFNLLCVWILFQKI